MQQELSGRSGCYYGEVSMTAENYASIRKTIKVDDLKVKYPNDHNPTIFCMKAGTGEWIHGPLALDKYREHCLKLFS